jgi:hypothetical protein
MFQNHIRLPKDLDSMVLGHLFWLLLLRHSCWYASLLWLARKIVIVAMWKKK